MREAIVMGEKRVYGKKAMKKLWKKVINFHKNRRKLILTMGIVSFAGIVLSIVLFIVSNLSTKAASNLFVQGIAATKFDATRAGITTVYNGNTLQYSLNAYYRASGKPINTTTVKYVSETIDLDEYNKITANATDEINSLILKLLNKKNQREYLENAIFILLVISQTLNGWFAFALEYREHPKKLRTAKKK